MQNQKILIIGFGVTGKSALDYVLREGGIPTLVESKSEENFSSDEITEFKNRGAKMLFETNDLNELDFDMIITSPGVKYSNPILAKAQSQNILIHNDITLFIENWRDVGPIVGVTGSNGKSTIVSLLAETLNHTGRRAILVGNIGKSPLDYLSADLAKGTIAVIELSSYQLETFKAHHAVDIAVISNLSSNHLDRYHGKMQDYALAKLNISEKSRTKLIFDIDDAGNQKYISPFLKKYAKEIFAISLVTDVSEAQYEGIYTDSKSNLVSFLKNESKIIFEKVNNRNMMGLHNLYNIAIVMQVLILLDALNDNAVKFIREYRGLEHRIEKVAEHKGVLYINDSKSTSPDATRVAIETFAKGKNLILIAGGENKGMTFDLILPLIQEHVKTVILVPGDAGDLLAEQIRAIDSGFGIRNVSDMQQAVKTAGDLAKNGDVVLLSPSSSSLNTYKSFEHRGEVFKEAVHDYISAN